MAYPKGHRAAVRKRIVQSARRLFNRHGFEKVSLNRIMAGAGLTRGAFYSYFDSKSDLYVEVLNCFFVDPHWENCWDDVEVDLSSSDAGAQVVRAYLSREHFEDVENSCPMVALPTDVSRSSEWARHAFEVVFQAMVGVLERSITFSERRRDRAEAIAALSIGGMIIARTLADPRHSDKLRAACMAIALELGGWSAKKS
jgi:TetR/AcrR family transcriptional repressor of nem operon